MGYMADYFRISRNQNDPLLEKVIQENRRNPAHAHQESQVLTQIGADLSHWAHALIFCGTYALTVYQLAFNPKGSFISIPTTTISLAIPPKSLPTGAASLRNHLSDHCGYQESQEERLYLYRYRNPPETTKSYFTKTIGEKEVRLTFHTMLNHVGKMDPEEMMISDIACVALSDFTDCFEYPIPFMLPGGIKGNIISPSAWIVHKGMTFPRRQYFNKSLIDLLGIYLLATQMGELSSDVIQGLSHENFVADMMTVYDNLVYWHKHASSDQWDKLMALDPTKTLNRDTFRNAIEMMGGAPANHSTTIN